MTESKKCETCDKFFEKSPSNSVKVWGKRRYCSLSCSKRGKPSWNKGIPRTWETGGDFKKGNLPWNKGNGNYAKALGFGKWMEGRVSELSNNWKGDKVGYEALHQWVRRHKGAPMKCEWCGKESKIPQMIHWANKSNEYKRDLKDWVRLCAKCHKKHDKDRKQKKYLR